MSRLKIERRAFLAGTLSGFFAYATRNRCEGAFVQEPRGKAKRCVVLWMNGGPSQLDTFDPKPGTSTGGEFQTIPTSVPGLRISETLPQIARRMQELTVLRSLESSEGEHIRAQYYLHTGFRFVPDFPRPAMGAVVSHQSMPTDFPRYVTIGSRGYGPAFLGPDHAPFSIEEPEQARELLSSMRRKRGRIELLEELGAGFDTTHPNPALERRRSVVSQIERLVVTPFVDAFKLEREPKHARERYGYHRFGRSCLLARRLLEIGVPFVEVQHDGWDTHSNNFPAVRELCQTIDGPWAALLDDLKRSGMLEDTLVLWMGEFGRTPKINATAGRDHFPQVTPAVIGGGGIQGGGVVGATNELGTEIDGTSYKVQDLFATVFAALGIDPAEEFRTSFDSPTSATDGGSPIAELLG